VWYASVQKCFGLPAGMAVMLCSPRALERAAQIGERQHYNSLLYLQEMMQKFQTTYTPNVLNIYLLMRVMQERSDIQETQCILQERYQAWIDTLSTLPYLDLLITNEAVRSLTVIPFTAEKPIIDQVRRMAREQGMVLGNGYGRWKESSLRIANFPALEASEIKQLRDFFFSLSV
jgi:phosphoserine aminotransferase